jgi:hypothetical protein
VPARFSPFVGGEGRSFHHGCLDDAIHDIVERVFNIV